MRPLAAACVLKLFEAALCVDKQTANSSLLPPESETNNILFIGLLGNFCCYRLSLKVFEQSVFTSIHRQRSLKRNLEMRKYEKSTTYKSVNGGRFQPQDAAVGTILTV